MLLYPTAGGCQLDENQQSWGTLDVQREVASLREEVALLRAERQIAHEAIMERDALRKQVAGLTAERDEAQALVRSQDALISMKEACVANLTVERDLARRRCLELAEQRNEAWAGARRTLMPVVPQTYAEALAVYPWLDCPPHEWDNRSTPENAMWLIFAMATRLSSVEIALVWYGEQAGAIRRLAKNESAMLAIFSALELDGGDRAEHALGSLSSAHTITGSVRVNLGEPMKADPSRIPYEGEATISVEVAPSAATPGECDCGLQLLSYGNEINGQIHRAPSEKRPACPRWKKP